MDEQLDNDLKNRIKEAFENFDEASADEGWLQLRKKFSEEEPERRVFAWIWWGAAAAILLLFLGIGTWVYIQHNESNTFSYKLKISKPEKIVLQSEHHNTVHKNTIPKIMPGGSGRLANNTATIGHKAKLAKQLRSITKAPGYVKTADSKLFANNAPVKKPGNINKNDSTNITNKNTSGQQLDLAVKQNTVNTAQGSVVQQSGTLARDTVANSIVQATPKSSAKSMALVFAEEKNAKPQKNLEKSKNDNVKKVRFGVYAATYFNYSKGSNNQVNVGAGISSDLVISKNFRLESGVAISQNTLTYSGAVPTAAAIAQDRFYSAPTVKPSFFASAYGIPAAPSFKNYNASLVGLDIPLNIKYEFNPQKRDIYIVAGVSSGTFINEAYTYQYTYPSFNNSSSQPPESQTTTKNFNSFYFAKTLNLAFGVGYPLGKNHLVIEPFLKYPLEGIGAQQIRFGAGGLNLKFNFQSPKK